MRRSSLPLALGLGCALLCGCDDDRRPPETPSATDSPSYGLSAPVEIEQINTEYDADRKKAVELCKRFAGFADAIKDPTDYELWWRVLQAAGEVGKSRSYAEHARQNTALSQLLDENDGEIVKKMAGAANFVAEQKGCGAVDVGGAAAGSLRREVDKRLEDRLHEANQADYLITSHREAIGKPNLPTLTEQADEIEYATYLVAVALPTLAFDRDRMLDEAGSIHATLDRAIDAEKERQGKAGPEADKKASIDRQHQLENARELLEAEQQKLPAKRESEDQDLSEARRIYGDAFSRLDDAIHKRAAAHGH